MAQTGFRIWGRFSSPLGIPSLTPAGGSLAGPRWGFPRWPPLGVPSLAARSPLGRRSVAARSPLGRRSVVPGTLAGGLSGGLLICRVNGGLLRHRDRQTPEQLRQLIEVQRLDQV
jgi:hypothetical protein